MDAQLKGERNVGAGKVKSYTPNLGNTKGLSCDCLHIPFWACTTMESISELVEKYGLTHEDIKKPVSDTHLAVKTGENYLLT